MEKKPPASFYFFLTDKKIFVSLRLNTSVPLHPCDGNIVFTLNEIKE